MMLPVTIQVPQPGKSKVRLTLQAPDQVELFESASHVARVPLPLKGKVPEGALVFCGESVIPAPLVPLGL